ncbi:MAG: hypothetical protein AAGN46_15125 [Acidobacteriota bacterium]
MTGATATAEPTRVATRLLAIFAADSGKLAAFADSARKLFGLGSCSLCEITYGLAGEKPAWSDCKAEIDIPVVELHRDELTARQRQATGGRLPVVLAEVDDELLLLLDAETLNQSRPTVDALRDLLRTAADRRKLQIPGLGAA